MAVQRVSSLPSRAPVENLVRRLLGRAGERVPASQISWAGKGFHDVPCSGKQKPGLEMGGNEMQGKLADSCTEANIDPWSKSLRISKTSSSL